MAWTRSWISGVPGLALTLALTLGAVAEASEGEIPNHAVALIYHHVDTKTPSATSVSPALFTEHLDHLAEGGYTVRGLEDVAQALKTGADLPDRTVVFTFDDGYRSVYETAFPLLQARGWPFTVFVCPSDIDGRRGPLATWDQLREMGAAGATIANHGWDHGHLHRRLEGETDEAWAARVKTELLRAQARLEEEIGRAPDLFAYTYGEYDADLQEIVRGLGWTAVGQQSGAMGPHSDLAALPRFPMSGGDAGMKNFPVKVSCLPLPVLSAESAGPILPPGVGVVKPRPTLRLTLGEGDYRAHQLAAYASGQGPADLTWVDREAGIVDVRAKEPLRAGRSRYNITAPATDGTRYYWYSYTWIVGNSHKD